MQQAQICTSLTGNIKFYAQVADIPLVIFLILYNENFYAP
jgi:hypothetical protein